MNILKDDRTPFRRKKGPCIQANVDGKKQLARRHQLRRLPWK